MHTMDENPYQSPRETEDLPARAGSIQLDGDALIVASGAVLPAICIWSGEPVAGKRIRQWLDWCPNWVLWLAPIAPLAILMYFLVRKRCVIEFSLDPEIVRWNKRRRTIFLVVPTVVWLILGTITFLMPYLGLILSPIFIVGGLGHLFIIRIVHRESPLQVVGYRDGLFRITGFSPALLDRLKEVSGGGDDSEIAAPVA